MDKEEEKLLPKKEDPPKKPPRKKDPNTERFKTQYFRYYDDIKEFNNGTKEDW